MPCWASQCWVGCRPRPALRIAGSRVGARASQANTRSSPVPVKAANEGTARSGARAPDRGAWVAAAQAAPDPPPWRSAYAATSMPPAVHGGSDPLRVRESCRAHTLTVKHRSWRCLFGVSCSLTRLGRFRPACSYYASSGPCSLKRNSWIGWSTGTTSACSL